MFIKKVLCLISMCCLFAPLPLIGQVNIEQITPEKYECIKGFKNYLSYDLGPRFKCALEQENLISEFLTVSISYCHFLEISMEVTEEMHFNSDLGNGSPMSTFNPKAYTQNMCDKVKDLSSNFNTVFFRPDEDKKLWDTTRAEFTFSVNYK